MLYPWSVDAREAVKDIEDISRGLIAETNEIQEFLYHHRHHFVVATKGLGKSLLLLLKRSECQGRCIIIPQGTLLDVPELAFTNLTRETFSLLFDEEKMCLLWSLSIAIAIIKNLQKTDEIIDEDISDSLASLLKGTSYTVADVFAKILNSSNRKKFLGDMASDYNNVLISKIRTTKESVAVFIDNVDECFKKVPKEAWYVAQTSLVKSIYTLSRLNPSKLNLFASIRKEAFLKLRGTTEMFSQYDGVSLSLSYCKEDLKKIFVKNIQREKNENLFVRDLVTPNAAISSFLGTSNISHGHVQENEEIFDYIYRHTLQRPRDLMQIGGTLSKNNKEERNPEKPEGNNKIKSLINETAAVIAENYLSEIGPHLSITRGDINRIFALIDSNILSRDKLKELCMKFNGTVECFDSDCKKCMAKIHIFCELYKIGLLGYVVEDPTERQKYIQKFEKVGEKTFDEVRLLPISNYYLIHPILDQLIRERNDSYKNRIDTNNIVGNGRIWKLAQPVSPESIQRPTVFISSTIDLAEYRTEIENVVKQKGFSSIRSEFLNAPDSLAKCQELSRCCNYFVAILGNRYGCEIQGKSICEHEFDAAYEQNYKKIIVYVTPVDIDEWEDKQHLFLERVQGMANLGYARGEPVTPSTIKDRFEKDLLERITMLSKRD